MKNLLTLFGIGHIKFGASWASLLGCIVYYDIVRFFPQLNFLNGIIFFAVLALSMRMLRTSGIQGDPKEIVVDEFLGMLICLIIAGSSSFTVILLLFVIFRIIDILKVPPFNYLEKVGGVNGILWDDIGIGVAIGFAARYLLKFF